MEVELGFNPLLLAALSVALRLPYAQCSIAPTLLALGWSCCHITSAVCVSKEESGGKLSLLLSQCCPCPAEVPSAHAVLLLLQHPGKGMEMLP